MFNTINTLLSADYTVVFIGHEQEKDGKMYPKGDKRSIDPIRDFVDYVIYLKNNGVDKDGKVIPSSAYLAETDQWFARSRFETTPTYLPEWSVEALTEAVEIGIRGMEEKTGFAAISYAEQKEMNTTVEQDFDEMMSELAGYAEKFEDHADEWNAIVESNLGKGIRISQCTRLQSEAISIILDEIKDKAAELKL